MNYLDKNSMHSSVEPVTSKVTSKTCVNVLAMKMLPVLKPHEFEPYHSLATSVLRLRLFQFNCAHHNDKG